MNACQNLVFCVAGPLARLANSLISGLAIRRTSGFSFISVWRASLCLLFTVRRTCGEQEAHMLGIWFHLMDIISMLRMKNGRNARLLIFYWTKDAPIPPTSALAHFSGLGDVVAKLIQNVLTGLSGPRRPGAALGGIRTKDGGPNALYCEIKQLNEAWNWKHYQGD